MATVQVRLYHIAYSGWRLSLCKQVHEFNVTMTCSACSAAVERVLGRKQGDNLYESRDIANTNWFTILEVQKIDIDMEKQKVYVTSSLSDEDLLAALKKTGRECSYVGVNQ